MIKVDPAFWSGRRRVRVAEIGVVGAGPAGARAAELLADLGADVLCFDPRAPWEKPCGGGLPAAAFRNIPELVEIRALSREIRKLRLQSGNEAGIVLPLREPLYVIARRRLGSWQLDRARRAGAELIRSKIVGIEPANRGWRLRDDSGGDYRVRHLVGADGAASRVRRVVAPNLRPELAPTRVTYPRSSALLAPDEILFAFFDGAPGYLWDFPRTDHHSVGAAVMPGTWRRARIDAELLRYLAVDGNGNGNSRHGLEIAGAAVATARWLGGEYALIGGTDHALLGDAAGLADPATGEGIENALRSAAFLAESYARRGDFARYPDAARSVLEPEFRTMRTVRQVLYRRRFAERTIGIARRWRWAERVLRVLVDRCNEHRGRLGVAAASRRVTAPRGRRLSEAGTGG